MTTTEQRAFHRMTNEDWAFAFLMYPKIEEAARILGCSIALADSKYKEINS